MSKIVLFIGLLALVALFAYTTLNRTSEPTPEKPIETLAEPILEPCEGQHASIESCRRVTIVTGSPFSIVAPGGYCSRIDFLSGDAVISDHTKEGVLFRSTYSSEGVNGSSTFRYYQIKRGEALFGNYCE